MRTTRSACLVGSSLLAVGLGSTAVQDKGPGSNGPGADLAKLSWLTGHWGGDEGGRTVEEIWTDGAGGSMFGISRTIQNGKIREFEFIRIAEKDGRLAYLASPGGRFPPTVFPLLTAEGTSVVFENLEHDFPQRIEYKLDGDTLSVRISGGAGDKAKSMSWQWKRRPPK